MKKAWLMCGVSGSGKSSWIPEGKKVISRDVIRFNLLGAENDYFAHEKEVLKEFLNQVEKATDNEIFIDATHLTPKGRKKVMQRINKGYEVNCVYFDLPEAVCVERDNKRFGLAHVGVAAIHGQKLAFKKPASEEGFINIYNGEEIAYGEIVRNE